MGLLLGAAGDEAQALEMVAEPVLFQTALTDANGTALPGEEVTLTLELIDALGDKLYSEEHQARTDALGKISVMLGQGSAVSGSYSNEIWERTQKIHSVVLRHFDDSRIEAETPVGYVPSALHAEVAHGLSRQLADGTRYCLAVDDEGTLGVQTDTVKPIAIPAGYSRLIFHDEFDYQGLPDPQYWGYETGYVRNGELQYYTPGRLDNTNVYDGKLHIILRNDNNYPDDVNGGMCKYTSGSVITKDKVRFTYGRVDVRAKLPACKGTWPAIWLMPNDSEYGGWPRSGEIDIMEQVGFDPDWVYFTAHSWLQHGDNNKQHYKMRVPTNYTEFHVYSLEWSENKLTWYVDGKRGFTVVRNSPLWTGWPYDRAFYIILNLTFGGGWGGQQGVDATALPQTYEIDYVRVFQ